MKPGDSFDIDDDTTQKGVLDYLNRRKLKDLGTEATPWSNSDTDLRRILEIMMFYEKAGGRGYVNLYQRYQFQVDLSHLVDPRHAILVGRTRKPFHRMTIDG